MVWDIRHMVCPFWPHGLPFSTHHLPILDTPSAHLDSPPAVFGSPPAVFGTWAAGFDIGRPLGIPHSALDTRPSIVSPPAPRFRIVGAGSVPRCCLRRLPGNA